MRRTAEASACHIEENIRLIEGGRLELPEDADVPTFLLSDGKLLGKPFPTPAITVGTIFGKYQKSIPADAMEATSLKTARIAMSSMQFLHGQWQRTLWLLHADRHENGTLDQNFWLSLHSSDFFCRTFGPHSHVFYALCWVLELSAIAAASLTESQLGFRLAACFFSSTN